ncbi:MAG: hypothetical protein C4308_12870 [Chitinophagaceae bacterium]
MRKISILLFAILLPGIGAFAQKKKFHLKLEYGMKIGMNGSHFYLHDLQENNAPYIHTRWKTGFVLGAYVNMPLYKKISVQPEFLYSGMGGTYYDIREADTKVKARYNYFSIPVLAKYKISKKWAFIAGPQFDFLIQGKERVGGKNHIVSDGLKDFDIGATGGIEFWPVKRIFLSGRYMRGFNDVDYRADMMRYYMEGVQLTMGIKFSK